MSDSLPLVYDLTLPELKSLFSNNHEPPYRADQIWQGLYHRFWNDPEQFTSISKKLRSMLRLFFRFSALVEVKSFDSSDLRTHKTLFHLNDGQAIETVLMEYEERRTVCVSSQSGCAMGCVFCATGQMGFRKNCSPGEIVEQVIYYERYLQASGEKISNIVIMGMGEPFLNYEATLKAIDILNDPAGLGLGERRFTISTVGIVPAIIRFTQERRQINLAVSLHAANDTLRNQLLPINKKYPLRELLDACKNYCQVTGRRITFEWALIDGVNDSTSHAMELASLIRGMLCHVNLIPVNPSPKYNGKPTDLESVSSFKTILDNAHIPCSIRLKRGMDIRAGCGQLAYQD